MKTKYLHLSRHREKALTVCTSLLNTATVIPLCYKECVARTFIRVCVVNLLLNGNNQKYESVMAIKSFSKNTAVNAKSSLFNTIYKEVCTNFLSQVCAERF